MQNIPQFGLVLCFSHDANGIMDFWEGRPHRSSTTFATLYQGYMLSTGLITDDFSPDRLAEVAAGRCSYPFGFFPDNAVSKEVTRSGKFGSIPSKVIIYINYSSSM